MNFAFGNIHDGTFFTFGGFGAAGKVIPEVLAYVHCGVSDFAAEKLNDFAIGFFKLNSAVKAQSRDSGCNQGPGSNAGSEDGADDTDIQRNIKNGIIAVFEKDTGDIAFFDIFFDFFDDLVGFGVSVLTHGLYLLISIF